MLFFHDDVVLKFKKPLVMPFVDFVSRLERQRACEAEVEANRRLSADVYLGVADVRLGDDVYDHAVVMRRLPADRSLASLVGSRSPEVKAAMPGLAMCLAEFHARAARSPAIDAAARAEAVGDTWRVCLDALASFAGRFVDADTVARVDALASGYLRGRGRLFDERIDAGRVCDGHGDLLAGDVFVLDDGPRVLDCIEFDPRLRHVDVIADVAFLGMDLEFLGAPDVASAFLNAYQDAAGEQFPPTLVHHYLAQRAAIRADVACLRADQGTVGAAEEASRRLDLALSHLRSGRVVLGVICGLPGTGKSSLAAALNDELGWPVLRSDEIRREFAAPPGAGPLAAAYGSGPYSPDITRRTYMTLFERARAALERGQPVLLDATFTDREYQQIAERLASRTATDLVVLECRAAPDIVGPRLGARRAEATNVSGADEEIFRHVAAHAHPWTIAVPLDTGRQPLANAARIARAILEEDTAAPRIRPGT